MFVIQNHRNGQYFKGFAFPSFRAQSTPFRHMAVFLYRRWHAEFLLRVLRSRKTKNASNWRIISKFTEL